MMLKHTVTTVSLTLDIDPLKDSKEEILKKIKNIISKLDHNSDCLFYLSTTLYNIRKFGDRIKRYKDFFTDTTLTMEDCLHIAQYCKEIVLSFLQTPLTDFKNVYLYDSTTDRWIVVSPSGYLWLIYGDVEKKLKVLSNYIYSLIVDEVSVVDLKSALTFVNRCINSLFDSSADSTVLTELLTNETFVTNYQKLVSSIQSESMLNNISTNT